MKYIVGFNDCKEWGVPMEYAAAMAYAKQFRNIHNAHVFKMIEVATFPKFAQPKLLPRNASGPLPKETKK